MIVLTAAEASGDRLAAALIRAWRADRAEQRFLGFAGPAMVQAGGEGFTALGSTRDLSAAGFAELLPKLPSVLSARNRLKRQLEDRELEAAIFVDAPDLHLPLCSRAKQRGVSTALLVAPQFWAWRRRRAAKLASITDRVLCLFPFELDALKQHGVDARWVGHPAVDEALQLPDSRKSATPFSRLALLPGSRSAQVQLQLPLFAAAAKQALGDEIEIVVPWRLKKPPPVGRPEMEGLIFETKRPGMEVINEADLVLSSPGTGTLEAALLAKPQVCALRMRPSSWALARQLVRLPSAALPNILLDKTLVEEVLQPKGPGPIVQALRKLTDRWEQRQSQAQEIRTLLLEKLGPPGFGERCCAALEGLVSSRGRDR